MKISPPGMASLKMREGKRLVAYRDTKNVLTIGFGHTSAAGPPVVTTGLKITDAECDAIFARDLVKYEDTVNAAISHPIGQNAFDACVSLCYNIGQGGFTKSTVAKRINAGDIPAAAQAFLMWNKPPEIMGRRRGEMQQFLKPDVGVTSAPIPEVIHPSPLPPAVTPTHVGIGALIILAATAIASAWAHITTLLTHFLSHLF